jgi:large subunit ribosomal protein L1
MGPVAGSSRGIASSVPRLARGSSKKKIVNPDAMELSEATRVLRVSYYRYTTTLSTNSQALEISNPSSAYSLTLTTHHSKSSLPLRGRVQLPLEARRAPEVILVFAEPSSPSSDAATASGAHIIGGEELFPKILSGEIQPTKILSTPGMMPAVSKSLARYLGPKGLMPSAKRGGVGEGEELGKRIREAGGTLEWKADKLGVIRART